MTKDTKTQQSRTVFNKLSPSFAHVKLSDHTQFPCACASGTKPHLFATMLTTVTLKAFALFLMCSFMGVLLRLSLLRYEHVLQLYQILL